LVSTTRDQLSLLLSASSLSSMTPAPWTTPWIAPCRRSMSATRVRQGASFENVDDVILDRGAATAEVVDVGAHLAPRQRPLRSLR
jgi:hypothetical protein